MKDKLKRTIKLLELTINKTNSVLDKDITEKVERHREALSKVVASIEESKREIEQGKLENGESHEDVEACGREIEESIDRGDAEIIRLRKYLDDFGLMAEQQKWRKQEEFAAKQHQDQLKYDKVLYEQKMELERALKPEQRKRRNRSE